MSELAQGAALTIVVNGDERPIKAGDTVSDLLVALGLQNGRVAIERNLKICRGLNGPRPRLPQAIVTRLCSSSAADEGHLTRCG